MPDTCNSPESTPAPKRKEDKRNHRSAPFPSSSTSYQPIASKEARLRPGRTPRPNRSECGCGGRDPKRLGPRRFDTSRPSLGAGQQSKVSQLVSAPPPPGLKIHNQHFAPDGDGQADCLQAPFSTPARPSASKPYLGTIHSSISSCTQTFLFFLFAFLTSLSPPFGFLGASKYCAACTAGLLISNHNQITDLEVIFRLIDPPRHVCAASALWASALRLDLDLGPGPGASALSCSPPIGHCTLPHLHLHPQPHAKSPSFLSSADRSPHARPTSGPG